MIPSKFGYHTPSNVEEALDILANEEDAKILAGGQSLLPMIKLRFAEPSSLIDLNGIADLRTISEDGDTITIGAMATESDLLHSELLARDCPLIPAAAINIADPQVRNLGTIGGDIAHGDPANDHPAVMIACGASFVLRSKNGEREVAATDFFQDTYMTMLEETEVMVAIKIPKFGAKTGFGYFKLKRKTGDYATAGASVVLDMDGDTCTKASIALTNVGSIPIKVNAAEELLQGSKADEDVVHEAGRLAKEASDPVEDLRGSVEYKREMAGEMTKRAVRAATRQS